MSGSLTKSDQSFMRQFSMLIAGLSVLTVLLISLGWAIYNHEPKETNPNAPQQVAERIAPVGAVYAGDTGRAELLHVVVGDDPAHRDEDVAHAPLAQLVEDPGHERHVRARQDRHAHDVDVLLERGGHDHVRGLPEARVHDLEALVAEAACEHLGATVVAVEPGLGDQHLQRSVGHGPIVVAGRARPFG